MEGIERLENEVLEMNNYNISAIFDYLKSRDDLKECFNNEEKSIHQMYEFIYENARKQQIDNVAMIDNRVVYLWAVTYFMKSNEELGIKEKKENTTTPNEIKKEEKTQENNQISMFQEVQK